MLLDALLIYESSGDNRKVAKGTERVSFRIRTGHLLLACSTVRSRSTPMETHAIGRFNQSDRLTTLRRML